MLQRQDEVTQHCNSDYLLSTRTTREYEALELSDTWDDEKIAEYYKQSSRNHVSNLHCAGSSG